jgi:restriction system protein
LETKLILIDGQQLAELMVEYNIGVIASGCYEVKKLDLDYFEGG